MPEGANRPHVLIAGGGVTGLTTAYTLERETDFQITLVEAGHRLGGVIQTERRDGLVIEQGPDSLFTGKPEALELIDELGLGHQLIQPAASGFSMLLGNRLHSVPTGLVSLSGIDRSAIEAANFLSHEGKHRALHPQHVDPQTGDLSITDFFSCRYGDEFSEKVAEPLLAGTHAGDPAALSMKALFPRFFNPEGQAPAKGAGFVSLQGGMATLTEGLEDALVRTEVSLCDGVGRIERREEGFEVWKQEEPWRIHVDHICLAVSARAARSLVRPLCPEAARLLNEIQFESSTITTVLLDTDQLTQHLSGTGFLVPPRAESLLKGCTYSSMKWQGRAPEGKALIRFFFSPRCTDSELEEQVRRAFQLIGVKGEPLEVMSCRWEGAFPQYSLGHLDRLTQIESALQPHPVTLAGSSYRGVGIPDCIRQGREAARKIAEALN